MKKAYVIFWSMVLMLVLSSCQPTANLNQSNITTLSPSDANATLASYLKQINIKQGNPPADLDTEARYIEEMPDINVAFPLSVVGKGDVVIEIWVSTERSGTGNDGWINVVTERLNATKPELSDGRTVSYSIRSIDAGAQLDYLTLTEIRPDGWSVANELWDIMAVSRGVNSVMILKRSAGNTAGILMKSSTYKAYMERHPQLDLAELSEDVIAGKEVLGFTNPYTSDTALNMLVEVLNALSPGNPLSDKAESRFFELQKFAPPPAYTTAQMRESAIKGFINVMTMECQAYSNASALSDYVFMPFGVRHDNPVYSFTDISPDRREALDLWCKYITNEESQKLATQMGFNQHNDYTGSTLSLSGPELYSAQSLWKMNKSGGKPTVGVFITDTSGSMNGTRLNTLKDSLLNSIQYIGEDHYIGLISYGSDITIELPIAKFEGLHRAKFQGAVKGLTTNGNTHSYSAVLVALNMIEEYKKTVPDANFMIFLLTDGETRGGVSESVAAQLIVSYGTPVHTIGYGGEVSREELERVATYSEGFSINVSVEDVVYYLKNIFNSQF